MDLSYWKKQNEPLYQDLEWNIPEQKTGNIALVGGNSQSFSAIVRSAEFLTKTYPADIRIILPDSLRGKLPPVPDILFTPSTDSGSFAKSPLLNEALAATDFVILAGDVSKNSATAIALAEAVKNTEKPVLLAKDSVDLLAPEMNSLIEKNNLFILASLAQLQKVFRAIYYPKVLLLSMPLLPVIETLHKFTLSYQTAIITFHQNQIIVANHGEIITTPIEKTTHTPLSLWQGELACKIAAMNLYNPGTSLEATAAAI